MTGNPDNNMGPIVHLTLVSMLDDSVIRHPYCSSDGFVCEHTANTLARQVIYGNPIIVSGSFFIHNPVLFKMLRSGRDNILKSMIRNGRIHILSDTGDLARDQIIKAQQHEHMATELVSNTARFDEFRRVVDKLFAKGHERPIVMKLSKEERKLNDSMRSSLVKKILTRDSPYDLCFKSTRRSFDRFRNGLQRNFTSYTPRSACEISLREFKNDSNYRVEDNVMRMTDDVMTFANEAFYLARAATLTEHRSESVFVETFYSARFALEVPYVGVGPPNLQDSASIRVPLLSMISNRKNIIDRIFSDKRLVEDRQLYAANKASVHYAQRFEKSISEALGMRTSIFEKAERAKDNAESIVTAGSATAAIAYGVAKNLNDLRNAKVSRREMMTFLAATGLLQVSSECVIETYGPNILADRVAQYVSIESIDRDFFVDGEAEKLVDEPASWALSRIASESTRLSHCAPVTFLRADTGSITYRDWKKREGIA